MSNVLCDIHQWFRCLCSPFIIIYVKHSNGTFCQDSSAVSGAVLFARAAKWSSCLFTCSWEHGCNDPPPAHYQTYRWCEFWFIANHRWVTPRSYINKKQNVITWLQIFMLHLGGEGDWKHLCKLSWNILLSFQGGGGEIFFFSPSGCSCMAYWKLLGYWHILARKNYFIFVKCCVFNKLMWLKTVETCLATSSMPQCEM